MKVIESGSSGFRVDETDGGAPLGEAAVTVQAQAVTCPARDGGGDGRATQKSEVPRIGAAAQRMRDDVVDLDQMRGRNCMTSTPEWRRPSALPR